MNGDLIEKKIVLRAPRHRVWSALSDSAKFGSWFGVKFDGPFVAGAALRGTLVGTSVDADIAKAQKTHAGAAFDILVERVEA